jgi:general secretion pathway protein C
MIDRPAPVPVRPHDRLSSADERQVQCDALPSFSKAALKPLRSGNLAALFASLLMFALLCGVIAYWALQLAGRKPSVAPPEIVADPRAGVDLAAAGRLFGVAPVAGSHMPPPEVANIQVIGIAADPARGAAILSVDGKPGKPFLVGDTIVAGTKLGAVTADAVVVDRGGTRIELPAPARPSIALLSSGPSAASGRGGAARPTPLPPSVSSSPAPMPALPPSGSAAAAAAGSPHPPANMGQSGMVPPTVGTTMPPGAQAAGMQGGGAAAGSPPAVAPGAGQAAQPGGQHAAAQ